MSGPIQHGLPKSYPRCTAGKWGACDACKAAQARRMAARRAKQRRERAARERATQRLVAAYQDVFAVLVEQELRQDEEVAA